MNRRNLVAFCLALLAACSEEQAERKRAEKARSEAEHNRQCAAIDQAMSIVRARGRTDIVATDKVCSTVDLYDCAFKVELMVELAAARETTLADQIATIGEPCAGDRRFAAKWGIEAYRDHRKLLEESLDEMATLDDGRDDDARERQSMGR